MSLFFHKVNAQWVNFGNEFLKIGVSARGQAMGNSLVTMAYASEAIFYNPANLFNLQRKYDLAFTHSQYFSGLANFDYLALAKKAEKVSIGFGFVRFGVDNIPNTLYIYNNGVFDPEQIRYFSVTDNAFLLSFAKKSEKIHGLTWGVKTKFIYRHLGGFVNGYGFGFDLGATYVKGNYRLAAVVRDVTTSFTAWFYSLTDSVIQVLQATGNTVPHNSVEFTPPSLILAGSAEYGLGKKLNLRAELNMIADLAGKSNYLLNVGKTSFSPQMGVELVYSKVLFLRFGMHNFQYVQVFGDSLQVVRRVNFFPALGLGIKYKNFYLDYSLQNFANSAVDLQSHFISARLVFNYFGGKKRKP